MNRKYQVNDFVFVNPDRGRTPGMARIIEIFGDGPLQSATILYSNGEKDQFYFAHLYQNGDCIRAKTLFLKNRAETFGRKSSHEKN